MKKFGLIASLLYVCFLIGCGYTLQGSGSVLPSDIKTLSIKIAENNTTEPGLGLQLTEKLRTRFERYGVVRVVDPGEDADANLATTITKVQTRVRNVTGASDISLEQDLYVEVLAELKRKNGQILYRNTVGANSSFAGTSEVVVTGSSSFAQGDIGAQSLNSLGTREVSRGQQQQALDDVFDEVSRKLYLDAVAADF